MGDDRYWVSDEQIETIIEHARLENESEIKKMFRLIKKSQKIDN
jgi:hypothetical protein